MVAKVFLLLLFFIWRVPAQTYESKLEGNYFTINSAGDKNEGSPKPNVQRAVPINLISQLYENTRNNKAQPCRRRFNPDNIKIGVVQDQWVPGYSTQLIKSDPTYEKVETVNFESLKDAWKAQSLKNELPNEIKTAENEEIESEDRNVPGIHNNINKVSRDCDTEKQKIKLHPIEEEKYDDSSEHITIFDNLSEKEVYENHNNDDDCDNNNNKNTEEPSFRRFLTGKSQKINFPNNIKSPPSLQSVSPNVVPIKNNEITQNELLDKNEAYLQQNTNPALLEDPAKGSGVSELFESKMLLSQNSNIVCYACSTLSNPRCWEPDKRTTVKYCKKGHDACIKKSYNIDGTEVVLRDCAMSCTEVSTPAITPQYKTCSICHNDLCNGAFGIYRNEILLMLSFFVIFMKVLN